MTSIVSLTVEAGLQAEQDLLAAVCAGESEFRTAVLATQ